MGKSLTEIAQQLKDAVHKTKAVTEKVSDVKVQLIYAFNGMGKTRLSREFRLLIAPKDIESEPEKQEYSGVKVLYYNAFTEDLFYWDNDLEFDTEPKLKIHPNSFTKWILVEQGQDQNIISNFQNYTDDKLTPSFNEEYFKDDNEKKIKVEAFSEVKFSFERGNDERSHNIKISKGEESKANTDQRSHTPLLAQAHVYTYLIVKVSIVSFVDACACRHSRVNE